MNIINNNHLKLEKYQQVSEQQISYKFKSNFLFSDNFYVKPFGTSRLRFENKQVLNIKCLKKNSEQDSYHYEIIITKNIDQISKSRNSKLFLKGNFNIELEFWCPIYHLNLDSVNLNKLIPSDYGTIDYNNIQSSSYLFGVVVPFYSRHQFVSQFLDSLKETNLQNTIVVFVDESMTKDVNDDHQQVHKLVSEFQLESPLIKIFKHRHGNMNDSILYGLDLLANYCQFLSTIDSDTIHKKDWLPSVHQSWIQASQDFPQANILASGFNAQSENHSVIEKKDNYILKTSVGGCHMFFKQELYLSHIRRCLHSHKWDVNIVNSLRETEYHVITTNPSVVQHIGSKTSVGRVNTLSFDYAIDF